MPLPEKPNHVISYHVSFCIKSNHILSNQMSAMIQWYQIKIKIILGYDMVGICPVRMDNLTYEPNPRFSKIGHCIVHGGNAYCIWQHLMQAAHVKCMLHAHKNRGQKKTIKFTATNPLPSLSSHEAKQLHGQGLAGTWLYHAAAFVPPKHPVGQPRPVHVAPNPW